MMSNDQWTIRTLGQLLWRELFQTDDLGVGVVLEKQTQAVRNAERIVGRARRIVRNSTDEQGHSRLRSVMRFHRRQFGGLQPAHDAGAVGRRSEFAAGC